MRKKPRKLEKIEDLLDQLPFSDQQKDDWVSVYKDRYQILHNKGVEDTVKCILHSLIFGDKDERENALKLLEITFVKRDSLEGAVKTIDFYRSSPEHVISMVNIFRNYVQMSRPDVHRRAKEWERTYGAALQGELLEAVMENSGIPLTEEQKAKIRADHKRYARNLARERAREKKGKVPNLEDSEDFRMASTLGVKEYRKYLEDKEQREADNNKEVKEKTKPPLKYAQDALDLINDMLDITDTNDEIQMRDLRYAHGERPFAISVFAAMHSLTYDGVEEIYTAWEQQNPSHSPAKNKK